MAKEEIIDIVDEKDNVIGKKPRSEVEKKALLHREADVIVSNKKGHLFVHKRAPTLFLYPNKWSLTAGGFVASGETYKETAKRELKEELGISNVSLKFLFAHRVRSPIHNSNKKVFICNYEGPFKLQKEEATEGRFMPIGKIEKLYKKNELSQTAKSIFEKIKRGEIKSQIIKS